VGRRLGLHSDGQVRLIFFSRVNLACFGFEAARFDGQLVLRARWDAEGHFALVVGHAFPSKFLLIRPPDSRSRAGKSETLVRKHGRENDENAGMRIA
jgi:hypothetical protein